MEIYLYKNEYGGGRKTYTRFNIFDILLEEIEYGEDKYYDFTKENDKI